jgi:hypothetical protein
MPVILKYHGHATTENFSSDDVAWAVRVDSGATVKQIRCYFLGIEDDDWLSCCI